MFKYYWTVMLKVFVQLIMLRVSLVIRYTVIIFLVLIAQDATAQQGTLPCGLNYKIFKTIPEKSFQAIDTAFSANQRQGVSEKISSATVAYNFKTHFVPDRDGNWKTILPGIDSWFLKLRSNGAFGLAVVFTGMKLRPGETLYIYNQQGLRGPFTNRNAPRSGILPLDFLRGDEIMIEYNVPAGSQSRGTFVVETVSHAYQDIFISDNHHSEKTGAARYSDDCYLCLEDDAIVNERRASVKLIVQYENSTRICTGTLLNNTANDNKPYILTAEHCVANQADADRTVFIFDYEDENCIKQALHPDLMLNGAFHRASLTENDFSILELYDKPPLEFHPYYAGWDISDQYLQGVTCIHHAQGGPRRVSVSNGAVRTSNLDDGPIRAQNAFWRVFRWDVGATEPGSSGASLLNKNGHVIGTLSGGSAQCDAPYNDYFAKLSASWEASSDPDQQLKYWLDPSGAGVQKLDGRDPFKGIHANCNTTSNVKPGEQETLLPYTNGQGYFSGYNSDGIASYAEKISVTDSAMLTGVMLNVGSVNKDSPGGLLVSVHGSQDGIPGPTLLDSFIPYYRLTDDTLNYVGFYPYVKLAGDFFISYTLSYSPEDSFALKQSDWRSNSSNTAFVKLSSGWVPMSAISPNAAGSSLGIKITLCEDEPVGPPTPVTSISFYPNPTTTVLIGKLPDHAQEGLHLSVYDLQGRRQNVPYTVYENNVVVTTADLLPGMYILRVSGLQTLYQSKFVKR
jgi:lysyl endopeptidase